MDKQYFLRPGIQSQHHFDSSISPSPVSTWQSLPTPPDQSFLNHYNWDNTNNYNKSTQHFNYTHFVSPPPAPATTSTAPTDGFTIRELIGKLGTICTATEITPSLPPASPYSANNSCYSTPLNSPPKTNIQIENLHNFKNSMPLSPPLPAVAADPGFAERAAKFSSFGSRSFNGRTNQFRPNKNESQYRSITPFTGSGKLHRVSSNPSLNLAGSSMGVQEIKSPAHVKLNSLANDPKFNRLSASAANSNDDSSVSEQTPSGETGFRGQNNVDSRKRKPISRGNAKEDSANVIKKAGDEYLKAKRSKLTERNVKSEEEINNGTEEGQKQGKNNDSPKPPEPPKDYIHVRARRGQATDSHSLAERVRREKIGERMKLLQNLVPGCNKVTGKALMLDEIINYVQSLQCQVEFLSMKLASVNPRLDINMDSILSKDIFQQNSTMPHQNHPINSSIPALFGRQNQQIHNNLSSNGVVDPLALNLPQFDAFGDHLSQFSTFYGDDLQSIVQMGFGENHSSDLPFQLQSFDDAGQNQTSQMKIEL